ncbi:hypothetical protein [Bacillus phage FI_KG-Lek]|nr:hypothetical protein [Bacillus phage FI_KG-Lek]
MLQIQRESKLLNKEGSWRVFKLSDGIRQKLTEIRLNHEVITEE